MPNTNKPLAVAFVIQEGQVDQLLADVDTEGGHADSAAEPYNPPPGLADLFGDQQFEPLMIIVVTLSVGFLFKRIATVYSDLSHPKGLLVDARVSPANVIETEALHRGEVIIIRADRTDSFTLDEKDAALEALKEIFTAGND